MANAQLQLELASRPSLTTRTRHLKSCGAVPSHLQLISVQALALTGVACRGYLYPGLLSLETLCLWLGTEYDDDSMRPGSPECKLAARVEANHLPASPGTRCGRRNKDSSGIASFASQHLLDLRRGSSPQFCLQVLGLSHGKI